MSAWLDTLLMLVVLSGLFLLGTSRLGALIEVLALQAFVLSLLPFLVHGGEVSVHSVVIFLGMLTFKVFLIPSILSWAIRHVSIRREVKPLIGYGASILSGGVLIAGSFVFSSSMVLPGEVVSNLLVPCAFSTMMIGLLIVVSRTRAIAQVVGYLVVENGIYLFGLCLIKEMPLLVEVGILLDVFVGVFVMGIVINHINEAFDHTDTARLTLLKD